MQIWQNRSDCIFNHSPNTRPNTKPDRPKPRQKQCKYGAKCNRSNCKYFHSGGNNNQRKGRGAGTGGKPFTGTCYRCGRTGHNAGGCYSKYDINKEFIKQGTAWKHKPKSDKSDDDFKHYTPNKNPNHALHNEQQQRDKHVWYDERNGGRNQSNESW